MRSADVMNVQSELAFLISPLSSVQHLRVLQVFQTILEKILVVQTFQK